MLKAILAWKQVNLGTSERRVFLGIFLYSLGKTWPPQNGLSIHFFGSKCTDGVLQASGRCSHRALPEHEALPWEESDNRPKTWLSFVLVVGLSENSWNHWNIALPVPSRLSVARENQWDTSLSTGATLWSLRALSPSVCSHKKIAEGKYSPDWIPCYVHYHYFNSIMGIN